MKKLKYLQTVEDEHFYRIENTAIPVKRILASLYSSKSGAKSICWLVQFKRDINDAIAPVELWKKANRVETWQALLDDSKQPQTEILINPVVGTEVFNDHSVIKTLNRVARKWGKPEPYGEVADPLDRSALKEALDFLESDDQIEWDFYSGKTKAEEILKHGDITRPEVAALAQGIIYLNEKLSQNDDFISPCGSVRRDNRSYIKRIGNSTFSPRSIYK